MNRPTAIIDDFISAIANKEARSAWSENQHCFKNHRYLEDIQAGISSPVYLEAPRPVFGCTPTLSPSTGLAAPVGSGQRRVNACRRFPLASIAASQMDSGQLQHDPLTRSIVTQTEPGSALAHNQASVTPIRIATDCLLQLVLGEGKRDLVTSLTEVRPGGASATQKRGYSDTIQEGDARKRILSRTRWKYFPSSQCTRPRAFLRFERQNTWNPQTDPFADEIRSQRNAPHPNTFSSSNSMRCFGRNGAAMETQPSSCTRDSRACHPPNDGNCQC